MNNPCKSWLNGLTIALVLAALSGCAPKKMRPLDTELEIQKNIDVGIILDTTVPLQLSIPIKNLSDRTLTIQKIAKDCSCISVKVDKLKLAPGETATMQFISNLAGKSGLYMSDIIVESDATEKIDEIQIRGRITGQIRVRPLRATILTGETRVPASFTVYCDNQDGEWSYTGSSSEDPNLKIQLQEKERTPTTSVYEGTVDIATEEARSRYQAYGTALTRLEFKNDHLGKTFTINLPIDIAVRRAVTVDPLQVIFVFKGSEQRRTVLVQSAQELSIDAARCDSPCVKPIIRRIDPNTLAIDFDFLPALAAGVIPENLACRFVSDGKTIASVPINFLHIP